MTALYLIGLSAILFFALGVLAGATWVETIQDQRSRRQAARQRELNDQARSLREQWAVLRDYPAAAEEDMRWHAKRQAGLVVLNQEDVS